MNPKASAVRSRGHCLLWNRSNATRTACDSSHSVAIVDIDNEGRGVKAMPHGMAVPRSVVAGSLSQRRYQGGELSDAESENNRAIRVNSKANRSDQQNKYIFAPQAARARHVAHTPHPQPHAS